MIRFIKKLIIRWLMTDFINEAKEKKKHEDEEMERKYIEFYSNNDNT